MQVTYSLEMLLFLLFVDQAILTIGLPILILVLPSIKVLAYAKFIRDSKMLTKILKAL